MCLNHQYGALHVHCHPVSFAVLMTGRIMSMMIFNVFGDNADYIHEGNGVACIVLFFMIK